MTVHIFGGLFNDIFIYGDKPHRSEIMETPGGSGYTTALGLSLLGHEVFLHANLGQDKNGEYILEEMEGNGLNRHFIKRTQNPTGIFISKNTRPIAVQRGANAVETPLEDHHVDGCAALFFPTEITEKACIENLNKDWLKSFVDLGPRFRNKTFEHPGEHHLILANEGESLHSKCDVIKMAERGASWGTINVPGNHQIMSHTTGAGDIFDVVFVHEYLLGSEKRQILKRAVTTAQTACAIKGSSNKTKVLREYNELI